MNSHKSRILVTGANGQLGMELQKISPLFSGFDFIFTGRDDLPIEDHKAVKEYFKPGLFNFCINCAAYTAVDKAESETEKAYSINAEAVGNLAFTCSENNTTFIHISTDFVFDGKATEPYKETDKTLPLNVYGKSKLLGEDLVFKYNSTAIIIRTSWLYSSYGNNFVKTMLRLMNEKESINIVEDQLGCPTYAADLAVGIMKIIGKLDLPKNKNSGIYHFANKGIISWYEFALAIKELSGSKCIIYPIPSSGYRSAAQRPAYSALNTDKIRKVFGIEIPQWKDSLQKCLEVIRKYKDQAPR